MPAFVRPYLLLILGSAILLSFFIVNNEGDPAEAGQVETPHSREALPDRPPAGGPPEQSASVSVPQEQEQQVSVQDTPTATPTATVVPTATPTATPTPQPTPVVTDLDTTTNVLILGSDQRPHQPNWRTDVIILLMMNPDLGEAAIVSFPRDMYIDRIPGHLPNRINVIDYLGEMDAPGGGGPRLLIKILEERLGITIDNYIRFSFEGFVDLIDALDGLKIHVDCYLYEIYPEEGIYLNLPPGEHILTGEQALSYVRSRRSGGGDLERARRQQRVVWALRKQLAEQNLLPKALDLYDALRYSVYTDVSKWDTLKYARFGLSLGEADVKGLVLRPPDAMRAGWRQDMSVFIVNWDYIAEELKRIFDRPPLIDTNTSFSPEIPQPNDGGGSAPVSRAECP
ncbi:MAG: LCP family protein [Caldilineaceae bacterium]|nr:LCP family protein [Caldilineaceae bacterium]